MKNMKKLNLSKTTIFLCLTIVVMIFICLILLLQGKWQLIPVFFISGYGCFWLSFYRIESCNLQIIDQKLILKSEVKEKSFDISEIIINGMDEIYRPSFYLRMNDERFFLIYSKKNIEILKLVIPLCKNSKISIEELEAKVRRAFVSPK